MSYKIHLDNFEGPLDLLLYFIRRDELDIYDIPIAKITRDFINVIEEWKKLNILIAGDFIVMASTLMRIKARIMIPRPDIDEDGEIIDVSVSERGRETVMVAGEPVEATRYLMDSDIDVDLWYDDAGRWVKLSFTARGQEIEYVLSQSY